MNGKVLRKHSPNGKIAAPVLLKQFISGNESPLQHVLPYHLAFYDIRREPHVLQKVCPEAEIGF